MQARLIAAEAAAVARPPSRPDTAQQLDLAEVGYLLRLAPERLALFHDLRSADQALELADARLQAMDNPMHIALRQQIADARRALSATSVPNPVAISADLDAVQANLAGLTFGGEAGAVQAATETAPAEIGWWARLKRSMASLVTVRRQTEEANSRLTLDDKDMLRQGLWLQVEGARLALMRHDQAGWQDTLGRAMAALDRWFDEASPEYRAVYSELERLLQLSISPDLPDITGPWAQLEILRQLSPMPESSRAEPESDPGDPVPAEETVPVESESTQQQAEDDSA
jgi:uroporphyrin-3 C-methyltransferase